MKQRKIKPINDNYSYCPLCGMLIDNCLCNRVETMKPPIEFWLITSDKEIYRPSNTGRLLKLVMGSSVKSFIWQRHQAPPGLLPLLRSEDYDISLLFPNDGGETIKGQGLKVKGLKTKVYILIDATWKEARKIIRQSPYLQNCPKSSFGEEVESTYDFRRGAGLGELCTYEAAVQVLKELGEERLANIGRRNFDLYRKAFKATIHGHLMKD